MRRTRPHASKAQQVSASTTLAADPLAFVPTAREPLLSQAFYARPAPVVARALIGAILVHHTPTGQRFGRIVETEAYDETDPASHSFRGPTPRTTVMFGVGGHAYVYRSYGLHWCLNISCGPKGFGAAVLVRAVEPFGGHTAMAQDRKLDATDPVARLRLCRGPGNVAQAFGIHAAHNGASMRGPQLCVYRGPPLGAGEPVQAGPRIGISVAEETPWRFYLLGNPHVSGRRGRPISASRPA